MTKTKTVGVEALPEGIKVTFEAAEAGATAPATTSLRFSFGCSGSQPER